MGTHCSFIDWVYVSCWWSHLEMVVCVMSIALSRHCLKNRCVLVWCMAWALQMAQVTQWHTVTLCSKHNVTLRC